jgi:Tfp pilus assembly protein PilW
MDAHGIVRWTPSEAQGPTNVSLVTVVVDDGVPPLSATNSFSVTVLESNSPPVLPVQADRTISAGTLLTVTNTASDSDLPTNVLAYTLSNPPGGALIDATGIITWTPDAGQAPSTNTITTIVTDDGVPPLSATNAFVVVVQANDQPPVDIISFTVSNDVATLVWSSVAGRTYRAQFRTNIGDVGWNDLLPDVLATGTTATTTNALGGAPQRFYRVMILP